MKVSLPQFTFYKYFIRSLVDYFLVLCLLIKFLKQKKKMSPFLVCQSSGYDTCLSRKQHEFNSRTDRQYFLLKKVQICMRIAYLYNVRCFQVLRLITPNSMSLKWLERLTKTHQRGSNRIDLFEVSPQVILWPSSNELKYDEWEKNFYFSQLMSINYRKMIFIFLLFKEQ